MVTSSSRLAYGDCFDIFDMALEDSHGARIACGSVGEAKQLRVRLHSARAIDRKDNLVVYDPKHDLYGRSSYDALAVKIKEIDGQHYLYVEKIQLNKSVEPLSQVQGNGADKIEAPQEIKQIGFRRV